MISTVSFTDEKQLKLHIYTYDIGSTNFLNQSKSRSRRENKTKQTIDNTVIQEQTSKYKFFNRLFKNKLSSVPCMQHSMSVYEFAEKNNNVLSF